MEHQNDSNLHENHEEHHHEEHHHDEGFWRKYFFSVDHKTIGIQYGITSLVFVFFGFVLMMLMRCGFTCLTFSEVGEYVNISCI